MVFVNINCYNNKRHLQRVCTLSHSVGAIGWPKARVFLGCKAISLVQETHKRLVFGFRYSKQDLQRRQYTCNPGCGLKIPCSLLGLIEHSKGTSRRRWGWGRACCPAEESLS